MFRARSRSPLSHTTSIGQQETHDFYILNIPLDWKYNKIKTFIKNKSQSAGYSDAVKYVTVLYDENGVSKGACIVKYTDPDACKVAMKFLMGAECEGRKLVVLKDASNILNHKATPRNNPKDATQSTYESYGLSANFLNSLEIIPPLINHLHVSNLSFDVTDEKLHEVFSLAGQVIHITHMKSSNGKSRGIAKIIYDHPVEAVQAISMFHGQLLLDRPMHIKMDRMFQKESCLPIGLAGIGPGLGPNGEPMRGVRVSLEFQPVKQMLIDELEKLRDETKSKNVSSSVQESTAPGLNSAVNVMSNTPTHQLLQMLQGASASNISATLAALRNQNSGLATNAVGINAHGQNFNQNLDIAQNVPSVVPNVPSLAHNLTGIGQNVSNLPNFAQNVANIQNVPGLTQNMQTVAQNMQNLAHNLPAMAQSLPALIQNMPNLAQSMLMNQNIAAIANQNTQTLAQNASAIGTNVQSLGQNVANLSQTNSTSSEWKLHNQNANHQSSNQHTNSYSQKRKHHQEDSRSTSKERDNSNKIKSSDMVIFKNLPSSVSLQSLTNKMREVGELKFTDMTGEGRALVRFLNVENAERCVKLFHRSKVDGQTIEVKFF